MSLTSVGVNVPEGLENAITWAQYVDLWQSKKELDRKEKNLEKRKQKGKLGNIFGELGPFAGGQVVVV